MAEKQVRKQKGMLSRLLRIGRHRSHRNVENTANDDGSAQSAELASNRIGRCAGGVDEARWMPPASTEHDSASTRQQPAQGYPRDVARIASSSKTNEDGDETQDSDAATASSSSESDMLDDIDRKITRLLEQMDAQQEKIKNLEAQVQQERAEKDQLQMQNAQLKSDLQRARVKKGNVREESIKTLTSRTIELQKTCDEMRQVVARKEMEFRGAFQKMREEVKELKKQKEQTKAIEQLNKQSKEYQTIINEVSQLRKQMQKARDDSQGTSDATEQTVTTDLPEQLQKIRQETNTENIKQKIPHIAVKQPQVRQKEMPKDSQQPSTSAREQTEESGRPKLREYKTDDELNEALSLIGDDPYMLPVYNAIKGKQRVLAKDAWRSKFIRMFGYPWNNPDVWIYLIGYGRERCIYIWTNPTKTIADNTLEAAVGEFIGCYRIQPPQYLYSPRHITSKVREICSRLTKYGWWCRTSYYYFFMNEQQQKIVSEMNVELPSGYRFEVVYPDRDLNKCFPCVAVRRGDQLMRIGYLRFEFSGGYGYYNEYNPPIPKEDESSVLSALETRVYQECISQRFCPLQSVRVDDKDEFDKYNNSELWTRLQDGDGNPIVVNVIL